jgi:Fe-S-cluster-containing dehydrogenase component
MAKHGLLIDYEYCTACHSCEVACKQEHGYPAGKWGIRVNEILTQGAEKLRIDNIPFPTEFCDLCAERTARGELPSCVKHCQARCMYYGTLTGLARQMEKQKRAVLFAPRASAKIPPSI